MLRSTTSPLPRGDSSRHYCGLFFGESIGEAAGPTTDDSGSDDVSALARLMM